MSSEIVFDKSLVFSENYNFRCSLFENLDTKECDILFTGDSLTEKCEWNELFPEFNVVNRGISGDTVIGLNERMDQITGIKATHLFILIGINDLQQKRNSTQILYYIEKIIEKLRIIESGCKVYFQSILPVITVNLESGVTNFQIRELNRDLNLLCISKKIGYLELHPHFTGINGELDPNFTYDGLHLNGNGYIKWAEIIRKSLELN
ncbi:MAG: sialate O-acetylesterase [Ignavibacteriaceae bacterium]|nr:sialate O-acetylesterase [Ignavibacteriaceae bacterium]